MWLLDHSLHEHAPRLRARAEMEEFDAHPAELKRIIKRPDVLPTGVSAGDVLGLLGRTSGVEMYAQAGERDGIVTEHALVPRTGPVRIRWVSDEIWPLLGGAVGGGVPRAAVLLDLLESDEPRVRREAARALAP
ncbi:MAG TPA: hypothetical protein VGY76_03390 [Solirubrobacteraceae bacterium]|jgi:hypothetical protein|nr:hypothetical protein [Solirubrobacteraceae bacterium]